MVTIIDKATVLKQKHQHHLGTSDPQALGWAPPSSLPRSCSRIVAGGGCHPAPEGPLFPSPAWQHRVPLKLGSEKRLGSPRGAGQATEAGPPSLYW